MIVALFLLTFFESIAATLIQRGIFFYTHENLGFSQSQNLWVALGFGVTYIGGALASHRLSKRHGEKAVLLGCILALLALP